MEYHVTGNINHDGKQYAPGDTIDLSENGTAATQLLAAGVISTEPMATIATAPAPEAAPEPQPEVSGKPMETGEPSIDGREPERTGGDNATDVTPGGMRALSPDVRADAPNAPQTGSDAPVEPTEDMKRPELEAMAVAEGVSEEDATAAANKGALVELILARRNGAAAPNSEPENDPSANL